MSEPDATGGWQELARAASAPPAQDDGGLLRELLAVQLAGDPYAIPVERVREIVRMRTVTPMPRVPPSVIGVIALRGEILEVVDLRRRLGMPAAEPTRRTRIVVLHGEDGQATGLLVDAVTEVLRLSEEDVVATAPGESDAVEALCTRGEEFVSLLDLEKVMDLDGES